MNDVHKTDAGVKMHLRFFSCHLKEEEYCKNDNVLMCGQFKY